MSAAQGLRERAIALNDSRLEGRISRADWAVEIASMTDDLAAAGLTWDDLNQGA